MEKVGQIMEKLWLVIIFLTIAYVAYIYFTLGFKGNEQLLFIPAIAIFWYFVRTKLRKRIEGNMRDDEK